jgi:hypothetical protein
MPATGVGVLFLGGNNLQTKIPTNWSDYIRSWWAASPRSPTAEIRQETERFRAFGTRRPPIEES